MATTTKTTSAASALPSISGAFGAGAFGLTNAGLVQSGQATYNTSGGITGTGKNSNISINPNVGVVYSGGGSGGGGSSPSYSSSASYTTPVIQQPTSYTIQAPSVAGATQGAGVGNTVTNIPSAPSATNYANNVIANNLSLGLNADGTSKVSAATGTQIKGVDQGFGFNSDGTPKTASQALVDRIQYKTPDIAAEYNRAQQQSGLDQAMQYKNDIQNQLNAKTTQMNLDLQNLRGVGAKEGVTEAVYGQQAAEVSREAMVNILPLQAQLAMANDNLQLAQQHTDTLFKIYSTEAQNQADLYNKQVDAVYAEATQRQKDAMDAQKQEKQNQFTLLNNQINHVNDLANKAAEAGNTTLYKSLTSTQPPTNVNSPTYQQDLANWSSSVNSAVASYGGLLTNTTGTMDTTQKTIDQLSFLQNTADEALKLSSASGPSAITRIVGDTFVGDTKYRQLESLTNTLKTNVLSLMTDPSIKKFFGPQMSNADVLLMTSAGTTLNPASNSPEQMKNEIGRLKSLFNRMQSSVKTGESTSNVVNNNLSTAPDGNVYQIID